MQTDNCPEKGGATMKTLRNIVKIDEERCNGCGLCIPNCPEGALRIINGKAKLESEIYCDGLGACIRASIRVTKSRNVNFASSEPKMRLNLLPDYLEKILNL